MVHQGRERQKVGDPEERPPGGHDDERIDRAEVCPLDRERSRPAIRTAVRDAVRAPVIQNDERLERRPA
jgi:hypothetical protein